MAKRNTLTDTTPASSNDVEEDGGKVKLYYMLGGCLAVLLGFAAILALPPGVRANDNDITTFTVDVGFRKLLYQQNNVDPAEKTDDGEFSPGDTFIQYGNIYPEHTIPDDVTPFDPETAPGAIGTYIARGTFTTNLANFILATNRDKDAPHDFAFATETFSFGTDRRTVMTDGILPNAHFSANRVVLGGTGTYRDVIGEVHEVNIGENKNGFCDLRVTFKIRKVSEARWR